MTLVVGNLHLLEGDLAGHPVLASGGRIRMIILQQLLTVGLGLPNVDPLGVNVLVAGIVQWVELHGEAVLQVRLQASDIDDYTREHPPAMKERNWFTIALPL